MIPNKTRIKSFQWACDDIFLFQFRRFWLLRIPFMELNLLSDVLYRWINVAAPLHCTRHHVVLGILIEVRDFLKSLDQLHCFPVSHVMTSSCYNVTYFTCMAYLTFWCVLTDVWVGGLGHNCFGYWLVAYSAARHYLYRSWYNVKWILWTKFRWNDTFIRENIVKYIVYRTSFMLCQLQYHNVCLVNSKCKHFVATEICSFIVMNFWFCDNISSFLS